MTLLLNHKARLNNIEEGNRFIDEFKAVKESVLISADKDSQASDSDFRDLSDGDNLQTKHCVTIQLENNLYFTIARKKSIIIDSDHHLQNVQRVNYLIIIY